MSSIIKAHGAFTEVGQRHRWYQGITVKFIRGQRGCNYIQILHTFVVAKKELVSLTWLNYLESDTWNCRYSHPKRETLVNFVMWYTCRLKNLSSPARIYLSADWKKAYVCQIQTQLDTMKVVQNLQVFDYQRSGSNAWFGRVQRYNFPEWDRRHDAQTWPRLPMASLWRLGDAPWHHCLCFRACVSRLSCCVYFEQRMSSAYVLPDAMMIRVNICI